MYTRCWVLILILVASLAGSANADVGQDAGAIADRYLAAMQRKGYAFLPTDELSRRRDQVAVFVAKHLRRPLWMSPPASRCSMASIVASTACTAAPPAKSTMATGSAAGGEEWMYLNDRDYFLTFQYHLWVGLTRQPLAPADLQRRDAQRQWMRQYLTDLPYRGDQGNFAARGNAQRRGPLMGARPVGKKPSPTRSTSCPSQCPTTASPSCRTDSSGSATASGLTFTTWRWRRWIGDFRRERILKPDMAGRIPAGFHSDDTVVDIWGNGPKLVFRVQRGLSRATMAGLSRSNVYDVVRLQ